MPDQPNAATSPADRSFAQLLRLYRKRERLSQEELAERALVSVRAVSDLERGARLRPRRDTVEMLARALELDENDRHVLEASVDRRRTRLPSTTPRSSSLRTGGRAGVPAWLTPLVGRERDEAQILSALRSRSRLVTLVGPAGVGKTRLACRVAESALEEGLVSCFVGLGATRDAALVANVIAEALGVEGGSGGEPLPAILDALREHELILILDNVEHVLPAMLLVSDILRAAPRARALITSREPVDVREEYLYPVAPLAIPPHETVVSYETAVTYPAARLFFDRAAAAGAPVALEAESIGLAVRICRRLDGLPLAIELAAGRLRDVGLAALAEALSTSAVLTLAGPRDAPDRQRNLYATINWSYELLDDDTKIALRATSVFAGPFSDDELAAIMGKPAPAVELDLDHLTRKNLIRHVDSGRFELLEIIRQFAGEVAERGGELPKLRGSHAGHFLKRAVDTAPDLAGANVTAALQAIDQALPNLRLALRYFIDSGRAAEAQRLAAALWRYWYLRGSFVEGLSWLETALALPDNGRQDARAAALVGAGALATAVGDNRQARAWLELALPAYELVNDDRGLGYAHNTLAVVALQESEYEVGVHHARAAIEHRRRIDDQLGAAQSLSNLASCLRYLGDTAAAITVTEEAIAALERADGGDVLLPITLTNLGQLASLIGSRERAAELFRKALTQAEGAGRPAATVLPLLDLGNLALDGGRNEEARRWYSRSLKASRQSGDKANEALAILNLANLSRVEGDFETARLQARQGMDQARRLNFPRVAAYGLLYLGAVERDSGRLDDSARWYRQCLTVNMDTRHHDGIAECLEHASWLLVAAGDAESAERAALSAARLRAAAGIELSPLDQSAHDRALAHVKMGTSLPAATPPALVDPMAEAEQTRAALSRIGT